MTHFEMLKDFLILVGIEPHTEENIEGKKRYQAKYGGSNPTMVITIVTGKWGCRFQKLTDAEKMQCDHSSDMHIMFVFDEHGTFKYVTAYPAEDY